MCCPCGVFSASNLLLNREATDVNLDIRQLVFEQKLGEVASKINRMIHFVGGHCISDVSGASLLGRLHFICSRVVDFMLAD